MRFDTDIAVLGGGASGLMAALSAKKAAPHLRVDLFERQPRVGKKLLATGNGRCNLMNTDPSDDHYHGDLALLRAVRSVLPPNDLMAIFEKLGVQPHVEYGGRVFPMSQQASSVLDVLRLALSEYGVEEHCGMAVTSIRPASGGAELRFGDQVLYARRAIACFGGAASPQLGGTDGGLRLLTDCGHSAEPFRPALTGLLVDPRYTRPIKGVRLDANLTVLSRGRPVAQCRDDVIFSDWGLSGLGPMAVSRCAGEALANGPAEAVLDLLPGLDAPALLTERARRFPARPAGEVATGLINKKLAQHILRLSAPRLPFALPCRDVTREALTSFGAMLNGWRLPLTGVAGMEQAQVTSGGVLAQCVDPATLRSRVLPALYLAGEVLNLDGECGGYNLYWAFASGLTAGHCAARALEGTGRR